MLGAPSSPTLALLASVATAALIINAYINYRRLPNIKGPWLACISNFWLIYHTGRGDLYQALDDAFQKYGSPIRISTDFVATNDPNSIRNIFSPRANFIRGRWYHGMGLGADRHNVLTVLDEKEHATHKSRLVPSYTGKETDFEPSVDKIVEQMISTIQRDYTQKQRVLDFSKIASFFTLDVLTKVAFGLEIGFVRDNRDHQYDYQKILNSFMPIIELGCVSSTIFSIATAS